MGGVGVNELAPEAPDNVAPAEGRGFGFGRKLSPVASDYASQSLGPRGASCGSAIFSSSPRRGGRDLNKTSRSLLYGADGVVIKFHRILLRLNTTPSARSKDASRRFLDRAATPPRRGEENSRHHHLEQQLLAVGATFLRPSRLLSLLESRRTTTISPRVGPGDATSL